MAEITIEIDTDSVEELTLVHCPLCNASEQFSIGDYLLECAACGAQFVIVCGRQDVEEE